MKKIYILFSAGLLFAGVLQADVTTLKQFRDELPKYKTTQSIAIAQDIVNYYDSVYGSDRKVADQILKNAGLNIDALRALVSGTRGPVVAAQELEEAQELIDQLRAQLAEQKDARDALNNELADTKKVLADKNAQIGDLVTAKGELESARNALRDDLKERASEVLVLQQKVQDLIAAGADVTAIKQQLAQEQAKLVTAQANFKVQDDAAKEAAAQLAKQIAELQGKNGAQAAELERIKKELADVIAQLASARTANAGLNTALQDAQKQLASKTSTADDLQQTLNALTQQANSYQAQAQLLAKEVADLKAQIAQVGPGAGGVAQAALAKAQENLKILQADVAKKAGEVKTLQAQLQAEITARQAVQAALQAAQEEAEALRSQLDDVKGSQAKLADELQAAQKLAQDKTATAAELQQQLATLNQDNQAAQNELGKAQDTIKTLNNLIAQGGSSSQQLKDELREAQKIANDAKSNLIKLSVTFGKVKNELKAKIAALERDKSDLAVKLAQAEQTVDELGLASKAAQEARLVAEKKATELQAQLDAKTPVDITALRGGLEAALAAQAAAEGKLKGQSDLLAKLQKELGDIKTANTQLAAQAKAKEAQVAQLEKAAQDAQTKSATLNTQLAKEQAKLVDLQKQAEATQGLSAQVAAEKTKVAQLEQQAQAAKGQNQALNQQLAQERATLAEVQKQAEAAQGLSAQKIAAEKAQVAQLEQQAQAAKGQNQTLNQQLVEEKEKLAALQSSLKGAEGTNAQLAANLKKAQDELVAAKAAQQKQAAELLALEGKYKALVLTNTQLEATLKDLQAENAKVAAELVTAKKATTTAQEEVAALKKAQADKGTPLADLEQKLAQAEEITRVALDEQGKALALVQTQKDANGQLQTQVTDLTIKLKAAIVKGGSDVLAIQSKLDALTQAQKLSDAALSEAKGKAEELEKANTTLKADLAAEKLKVKSAQESLEKAKKEVEGAQKLNIDLGQRVQPLEAEVERLNQKIADLQKNPTSSQLAAARSEYARVQNELDSTVKGIETLKVQQGLALKAVQDDLGKVRTQFSDKDAAYIQLVAESNTLKTQFATAQADVDKQLKALNAEVAKLKAEIDAASKTPVTPPAAKASIAAEPRALTLTINGTDIVTPLGGKPNPEFASALASLDETSQDAIAQALIKLSSDDLERKNRIALLSRLYNATKDKAKEAVKRLGDAVANTINDAFIKKLELEKFK